MKGTLGWAWGILRRRPFSVLVQVTNRCNMRCPFCDFWPNGDPKSELDQAEWARVAEELGRIGRFLVSIEGGEPLLRPDLPAIIAAFARYGHLPLLYSNGWFLDHDKARELVDAGLHQAGISVDFPDASRHDLMRRTPGAWVRATQAAQNLETLLPGRVHLMSVLMKQNQHDLDDLLRLSARLRLGHHLTLLSDTGFRRARIEDATRPDVSAMARLPVLARRHPHLLSFRHYLDGVPRFLDGRRLPRCRAGIQSFNLDHTGQVSACIEKIDQPVGSVREAPLPVLTARLAAADLGRDCQDCWTLCRGTASALGQGGTPRSWADLRRM